MSIELTLWLIAIQLLVNFYFWAKISLNQDRVWKLKNADSDHEEAIDNLVDFMNRANDNGVVRTAQEYRAKLQEVWEQLDRSTSFTAETRTMVVNLEREHKEYHGELQRFAGMITGVERLAATHEQRLDSQASTLVDIQETIKERDSETVAAWKEIKSQNGRLDKLAETQRDCVTVRSLHRMEEALRELQGRVTKIEPTDGWIEVMKEIQAKHATLHQLYSQVNH